MTFANHFFELLELPWFEARIVFGSGAVRETDRKELARRLHENIAKQFTPLAASPTEDQ